MVELGNAPKVMIEPAGLRHATLINETLQRWEAVLDMRRTVIEADFVEQVAVLRFKGLADKRQLQIKASALTKDWQESRQKCTADFFRNMLSAENRRAVRTLGLQEHVDGHIARIFGDVSDRLQAGLEEAIRSAEVAPPSN